MVGGTVGLEMPCSNPGAVWTSAALNKPSSRAGPDRCSAAARGDSRGWGSGTGARDQRKGRLNRALQPGDLLAPSGVSQGDLPCLSPQLPLFRTRATTPAMPSILMPSLVLALAGELCGTSTWLWSGIPSLRGEKASGEPNSLYLWITTAAFNSLE